MPIYEYRCNDCGHRFAHLHRRSDESAPDCPTCGHAAPKKVFSTFHAAVATEKAPTCSLGTCPANAACESGSCPLG